MKRVMVQRVTVAAMAIALAACSTFNTHKGAVIDTQLAASIQPGIDNKASVQKLLGTPSLAGQFTNNDWYYVSRDQAQMAYRDPHVSRHNVLHVRFDQAGNVASVGLTGRELVMNLTPSRRQTPTLGRKRSFFEELFGNIGTVNSAGSPTR
jgi:outer membrane protein assembly factor BamE (lipoprotein component of BamABCDE complex)